MTFCVIHRAGALIGSCDVTAQKQAEAPGWSLDVACGCSFAPSLKPIVGITGRFDPSKFNSTMLNPGSYLIFRHAFCSAHVLGGLHLDGPIRSRVGDAERDQAELNAPAHRRFFPRGEERMAPRFSETSALILVVVLSLALWAMIWGAFVGMSFVLRSLPGM